MKVFVSIHRAWVALLLFLVVGLVLLDVGQAAKSKEEGKKWSKEITNSIGIELVRIPAGKFKMGSPKAEQDAVVAYFERFSGKKVPEKVIIEEFRCEGPQHEVEISKEFWLGAHEVTQKQFNDVMGYNPSIYSNDGKGREGAKYFVKPGEGKDKVAGKDTSEYPVENVSYEEAVSFCKKLTEKETKSGRKYRLPTEAEWEYACRGGTALYQVFHFGSSLSSKQANFNGTMPYSGAAKHTYLQRTCKVGSYTRNKFGLYDMHGNVWEWCSDWYDRDYYSKSPRRDPAGPVKGEARVMRGGSEADDDWSCRSAFRTSGPSKDPVPDVGFRVALVPSGR
jgi:formylglycine-generating enzyme required for sulfatase activity